MIKPRTRSRRAKRTIPPVHLLSILLSICLVTGMSSLAFAGETDEASVGSGADQTQVAQIDSAISAAVPSSEPADDSAAPQTDMDEGTPSEQPDMTGDDAATAIEPAPTTEEASTGTTGVDDQAVQADSTTPAASPGQTRTASPVETDDAAEDTVLMTAGVSTLPEGYIIGPNSLLAYHISPEQTIDVRGSFNGEWISTTFGNYGFAPIVKVGNNFYWGSSDIRTSTGIVVTATPGFTDDGKGIYLSYLLELDETVPEPESYPLSWAAISSSILFDFGIGGDIYIDGDDEASVTMLDNGRGFIMTSGYSFNEEGEPASLAIYFSNTEGVDEPDAVWVGSYDDFLGSTIFQDQRQGIEDEDSAFAVSWHDLELSGNQQTSLAIGMSAGAMAENAFSEPEPEPNPAIAPKPAAPESTPALVQRASTAPASHRTSQLPETVDDTANPLSIAVIGLLFLGAGGMLLVSRKLRAS